MLAINKKTTVTINFSHREIEKLIKERIEKELGAKVKIGRIDWRDNNRGIVIEIEDSQNSINLFNQNRLEKIKVITFQESDKISDLFCKIKNNINLRTGEKMILSRLSNAMGPQCTVKELLSKTPEQIRKTGIHVYGEISHRFVVDTFRSLSVQLNAMPFMQYA